VPIDDDQHHPGGVGLEQLLGRQDGLLQVTIRSC
jgi:hypothetical protein